MKIKTILRWFVDELNENTCKLLAKCLLHNEALTVNVSYHYLFQSWPTHKEKNIPKTGNSKDLGNCHKNSFHLKKKKKVLSRLS